jgi:hypothetical protein
MENAGMTLDDAQCHLDGLPRGHRLARLRSRAHSANQSVIAAFAFKAIQIDSVLCSGNKHWSGFAGEKRRA